MNNRLSLAISAVVKYLAGVAVMSALLFLPAGSWCFVGAWRLMLLLFIPMFILGVALLIFAPELLKKRLKSKESRSKQSLAVKFSALIFIGGFIVAALDFRHSWSSMPMWVVVVASAIFLLSYALYGEVMRENMWLSRTIEVSENQTVISSGLYSIVRHPMYSVTLTLFLSMPLILGSWYSFALFMLYIPIIVLRIKDEERLLKSELNGYTEYCQRVRYRLIPYIW